MTFLSIHYIIFTLWGYKVSALEFFGVFLNILSVYLLENNSILNWPIGNIGAVLFAILFYQVRLYSEMIQQICFFLVGFYGWWQWLKLRGAANTKDLTVFSISMRAKAISMCVILAGGAFLGYITQNIATWFPIYMPDPASFPYLDALVVVSSFVGFYLFCFKKIEAWYLFGLVYIISIGINWVKGLYIMAFFFSILLMIAIRAVRKRMAIVNANGYNNKRIV